MKRKWMFVVVPPAIVLLTALCGEVVMHLWNWLIPMLFAGRTITFWQSLGLLLLCRILFGSWGSGGAGPSRSWRRRPEGWESMTPDQRDKFRQELRARWAGCGMPIGESKEPA